MTFRNESTNTVKIPDLGVECAPGDTCEIESGYANPAFSPGGIRLPAIVEQLAPQLLPADVAERERWLLGPIPELALKIKPLPSTEQLVKDGHAPGVAEIIAKKAKTRAVKEN